MVDEKLRQRGCENLSFYDGATHQRIFSLDKKIRQVLDTQGKTLTDSMTTKDDVFVPDMAYSSHYENFVNMVDLSEYSMIKVANPYHKTF